MSSAYPPPQRPESVADADLNYSAFTAWLIRDVAQSLGVPAEVAGEQVLVCRRCERIVPGCDCDPDEG